METEQVISSSSFTYSRRSLPRTREGTAWVAAPTPLPRVRRRPTHLVLLSQLDSTTWGRASDLLSSWVSALSMILAKASTSPELNASKTRRRTVLT